MSELINKDALIEHYCEKICHKEHDKCGRDDECRAIHTIREEDEATSYLSPTEHESFFRCSNCGSIQQLFGGKKYCPYCGYKISAVTYTPTFFDLFREDAIANA